jgi:hypothetical protein
VGDGGRGRGAFAVVLAVGEREEEVQH